MIKRKFRAAVRATYRSGGAVYFIRQGDFVKVGLSRDPLGRLRALQVASALPLSLVGLIPSTDAGALEKRLHGLWRGRAERGEWYRLSTDEITRGLASLSLASSYIDLDELWRDVQREAEAERRAAEKEARARKKAKRPAWTGVRLLGLRKRLRLSQEEMAGRLGYDRAGTISEFENGHREIPHRTALFLDMLEQQAPADDG